MASVSKRTWKTKAREQRTAWSLTYIDHSGKRHRQQFEKKRDADAALARVVSELTAGTYVADQQSITVRKAARLFLEDFHGLVNAGKARALDIHPVRTAYPASH